MRLGGRDFDECIFNRCIDLIQEQLRVRERPESQSHFAGKKIFTFTGLVFPDLDFFNLH